MQYICNIQHAAYVQYGVRNTHATCSVHAIGCSIHPTGSTHARSSVHAASRKYATCSMKNSACQHAMCMLHASMLCAHMQHTSSIPAAQNAVRLHRSAGSAPEQTLKAATWGSHPSCAPPPSADRRPRPKSMPTITTFCIARSSVPHGLRDTVE